MCGIVGILNFEKTKAVQKKVLSIMTNSIAHRGPDDSGTIILKNAGLGSRRLAIIDLSEKGHMPMPDEKKEFRRLRGLYRKETVHAHHSDISEDDWERVSVIAGGAISAERLRARLQHDSVRHEMRKILMNTPPPEEQEASLQQLRVAVEDLAAASHPRRMQGELEAQSRGSRKKFGKIRRKRDRAHADYCDTFDALPLRSRLGWRLMPFSESLIDSTRRQSVQAFVSIVNRLPTVEENREIVDDYTRLQLIARQAHQRLVHDTLSWR